MSAMHMFKKNTWQISDQQVFWKTGLAVKLLIYCFSRDEKYLAQLDKKFLAVLFIMLLYNNVDHATVRIYINYTVNSDGNNGI